MTAPRYPGIRSAEIPEVTDDDGARVRVICGRFWGRVGPVDGIAADPTYLDVSVPPGRRRTLPVTTSHQAFAYVIAGGGSFRNASEPRAMPTDRVGADGAPVQHGAGHRLGEVENKSLVLFSRGDEILVQAGEEGVRFLLVSGQPLREPVAWQGPIVMNTQAELRRAFRELQDGSFLRHGLLVLGAVLPVHIPNVNPVEDPDDQ
ncbi:MAG: pirin-like C-terminal cupin domain-containing protein [Acidobacteriota bacterium]